MKLELVIRFDHGSVVPWVRRTKRGISAIAVSDMIRLRSDAPLRGENMKTGAEFTVDQGQKVRFDLTWHPSNQHEPPVMNLRAGYLDEARDWRECFLEPSPVVITNLALFMGCAVNEGGQNWNCRLQGYEN
jgi:hypothetical protein